MPWDVIPYLSALGASHYARRKYQLQMDRLPWSNCTSQTHTEVHAGVGLGWTLILFWRFQQLWDCTSGAEFAEIPDKSSQRTQGCCTTPSTCRRSAWTGFPSTHPISNQLRIHVNLSSFSSQAEERSANLLGVTKILSASASLIGVTPFAGWFVGEFP